MPDPSTTRVLVTGMVPSGPSGMRDYGDLVADELRRRGATVEVAWAVNDERRLRTSLRAAAELARIARRADRSTAALWNYAPVASGYRGVPGPGALLGCLLRLRRAEVVVVLHELAEPWRGQPVSTRIRSVLAVAALIPVLIGAQSWVVTTEQRARRLRWAGRLLRRPIHFIPVFSNLGEVPRPPRPPDGTFRVGVLDYAATFARPAVVVGAAAELQADGEVELILIGSPGPGTPKATPWTEAAAAVDLRRLEFTGIVTVEEMGQRLADVDVIVLPNAQGPASRKGTLAAALGHARPVVSLDGPMRWNRLVDEGAVQVCPVDAGALAQALRALRVDPGRLEALGQAGGRFYLAEMSVARTTSRLASCYSATLPSS